MQGLFEKLGHTLREFIRIYGEIKLTIDSSAAHLNTEKQLGLNRRVIVFDNRKLKRVIKAMENHGWKYNGPIQIGHRLEQKSKRNNGKNH